MRLLRDVILLTLALCIVVGVAACAQETGVPLEARLFEGKINAIDTLGVRRFVEEVSESRTDSAEVYFNIRGEPVAWRGWIDGRYFVYWQPYGRFEVDESALVALEVFKENRQLLEMLEGLELVERAAKKTSE